MKLPVSIEIFTFRSARWGPEVPMYSSDDPGGVELRLSILSNYARGLVTDGPQLVNYPRPVNDIIPSQVC